MIEITKEAYLIMLAHCQSQYPLEACGFLGGEDSRATVVTAVENALHSPVAYEMDPRQQLEAMLYFEENGLDLLAAYHSHPHGPSGPSHTDIAQAYYPDLPQLIISLRLGPAPAARAFLLSQEEIHEIEIRIV
jgi:proteasome lid subunit RPN8/RPN11